MDTPSPKSSTKAEAEARLKLAERQAGYDQGVTTAHQDLKDTHTKKEYTFSVIEKRRLLEQQIMMGMGKDIMEMAKKAMDDIINLEVLKRLGIDILDCSEESSKISSLYDIVLGRLTVWQPKETKKPPK